MIVMHNRLERLNGNVEDGEKEFKNLTEENPTWGWGWIGWADEYGIYSKAETKNYCKVIEILTNALKVSGIDEKVEIKKCLKEIYENCGMTEEAKSIIIEKKTYGKLLSNVGSTLNSSKPVVNEVRKVTKIGRNEPCACGSGKNIRSVVETNNSKP